ncbi:MULTISPECIES: hypothetical protein [Mycolicibacterium]|uniref:Uncharacterized protein n=1 Tax=Mycolicibacterium phocaicum TaxID=319706 RepID=A0A7I7ZRZ7_9MYCO|nr:MULTISPECIES: hypothetical protein [Mycolicibacterium]SHV88210.1 Uncharacterised protein [Mycobacteroides abscessus subsp. abscessus]RUP34926.1 MAG: hypothetical protein EKK51_00800 [Mycolicibacterium sp.]TLH61031.1 hypothetical protein C1S79_25940 [Mycolicibacterium phocaicum]UCZ60342.1 hypothetical protein LHJ73_27495 [Mycolicibacterium phocaicum]BBZ57038.1 hypothetical protein MPHO_40300 [Mycolicibacterium phocaicum]
MGWNFLGTDWRLFGKLADVALLTLLFGATVMFFYVQRLRKQPQLPIAEGVRAKQTVLTKVRKGQPMTRDELEYATQVVGNQRTLMTFAIPLTVFSLGCFYVLGSLEQLHGATPSERTFLGVIAMVSSINITAQIFRVIKLKKRLSTVTLVDSAN